MSRIRWTDAEKNLIAAYIAKAGGLSETRSVAEQVRSALRALIDAGLFEASRFRHVHAEAKVAWIRDAVASITNSEKETRLRDTAEDAKHSVKEIQKRKPAVKAKKVVKAAQPVFRDEEVPNPAVVTIAVEPVAVSDYAKYVERREVEAEQQPQVSVTGFKTEQLVAELFRRATTVFDSSLKDLKNALVESIPKASDFRELIALEVQAALAQHVSTNSNAPSGAAIQFDVARHVAIDKPKEAVRNPRIAIVGLLGQQETAILKEFQDKIDLTFVKANTPSPQIRSRLVNAEKVFFMVKFSDHSTQAAIKSSKVDFQYVNGSVAALRSELRAYLNAASH